MSVHPDDKTLAVLSGNDLDNGVRTKIAMHVDDCAACQARVKEFRSISLRFQDLRLEPSDEDLRRVRETIAREVAAWQPNRVRMFGWIGAALAAAAIALLATYSIERSLTPEPLLRLTLAAPLPPASLPQVPLVIARERPKKLAAGLRSVSVVNGVLKMTTGDPNVVILLPLDEEGDKHEN